MILSLLLDRIGKDQYDYVSKTDLQVEIDGIRLLTINQSDFSSKILYFGNYDLLPSQLPKNQFINFIGYSNVPVTSDSLEFDDRYCNLILLKAKDRYASFNQIQNLFIEEQHSIGKIKKILDSLLSNRGLQHMLDIAYEIFHNPLFLCDNSFRYVAYHCENLDDDSEFGHIMKEELANKTLSKEAVNMIKKSDMDLVISNAKDGFYQYNELLKAGTLTASIKINNIEVAHLMLVEYQHPFTEEDAYCFYRLTCFISQEMQKNQFYKNNKGQMYSYFLIDLLNQNSPNPTSIQKQLDILQYKLFDKYYIAVLMPPKGTTSSVYLDEISAYLQNVLTGNIYAIYNQKFVILFNRKKESPLGDYTEETLLKCATINHLKAGISFEFSDISTALQYYNQALNAVEFGERFAPEEKLYHYRDFVHMDIFHRCASETDMLKFCQPEILKLKELDENNHSELMKTLYYYLEYNGNTKKVADKLFIHKNTLTYRMEKIKNILDSDLCSGHELFKWHMSFYILKYMRLLDLS